MPKLLLISSTNLANLRGVQNKLAGQAKAFMQHGMDVYWMYRKNTTIGVTHLNTQADTQLHNFANLYKANLFFFKASWKYICEIQPDILYIRHPTCCNWDYLSLLKKAHQHHMHIFTEIPTFPYDKGKKSVIGRVELFIDKYYRKKLHRYIEHAFIQNTYHQEVFGIPASQIGDGVDVSQFFARERNNLSSNELILVGVANLSTWHGYDRVITGLKKYYDSNHQKKIDFYIIGNGAELNNLKKLTSDYNLQNSVNFVGPKYGEQLYQFYNKADIGIGSLGMHRIGLFEGTPLKIREYCSLGLPFVIAYTDHDFPKTFPYSLQLEPNDSPLDISQLLEFYEKIRTKDYISDMREYTKEHLDWSVKIRPVVKKILEK